MSIEEELGGIRKRLDYALLQLEREAKFLPASRPENRRFHRAFSAVTEARNALGNIHYTETGKSMSILCGHCKQYHTSVEEVMVCSAANPIPEPIVGHGDPWEGATEREPGVWTAGPGYYLEQHRAEPQGQFGGPSAEELRKKAIDEQLKELTEGYYAMDDDIYQVVRSKVGRLYAKLRDEDSGSWGYAAGAIMKIKPEMRMDLDHIKNFGRETGTCLVCGRTLTNPESIANGIGPICAERF